MINTNWTRWIAASINNYIKLGLTGVETYVEGQIKSKEKLSEYVEIFLDGPDYKETSKDFYEVKIIVTVLCTNIINPEELYEKEELVGKVTSILNEVIQVYKYGDGELDDQSKLGCLVPTAQEIQTFQLGQKDPNTPVLRTEVSKEYRMELET